MTSCLIYWLEFNSIPIGKYVHGVIYLVPGGVPCIAVARHPVSNVTIVWKVLGVVLLPGGVPCQETCLYSYTYNVIYWQHN